MHAAMPSARNSPRTRLIAWLRALRLPLLAPILATGLALAPVVVQDDYIRRLLLISMLFGLQAILFDFTGGFISAVNFGFSAFVGLGAYVSALLVLKLGISPWLGLAAAFVVVGAVGFGTGALTLPLRGIFVSLMTWFVGLGLMALAMALVGITRGPRGLIVPPLWEDATLVAQYYVLLGLGVVIYLACWGITRSHIGLAFRAIGQDFDAARASGINPTRYKLLNFTLSCAFAGLLGGFYAHFVGVITPTIMDTSHTMEIMALSYIGGTGTLLGGFVTAFLFVPVFDYLKRLMEFRLIVYGLFLAVMMIAYPAGFAGIARSITTKLIPKAQRR